MNPGVKFYEDILSRQVMEPNDFSGGVNYALFRHQDSLHTFTLAYGRPQARYACWCADAVRADFTLDDLVVTADRRSRYLLKIVAAWKDWRSASWPVVITLNGNAIYNGPFFLENVCVGWPAQYIAIEPQYLNVGRNEIVISVEGGSENFLLLSKVEVLQQPDFVDFTIHSSPEAVAAGEPFWIQMHLMQSHPAIQVEVPEGKVEFIERQDDLFRFRALAEGENVSIVFRSEGKQCEARIDKIGPKRNPDRVPLWIGMEGSDIRHDTTGEMDRTLAHFIYSGVGNYMGFGLGPGRNSCPDLLPDTIVWRRWVTQCKDHGISMHYCGNSGSLEEFDFPAEAGEYFSGFQFHEPYLIFQPRVAELYMTEKLKSACNLQEKKDAYVSYIQERADGERKGSVEVFSGEPALTCIYSKEAGVDALLCEPVSNVSLLYGAARGTGIKFGAHIPADWYFGYPHDEETINRLKLAVWLAYAYGGQIIYIESSVFKTNANERNDWEDPFCVGVRKMLREFCSFSKLDERVGKPLVRLAIIYGNRESMFWMDDDRIVETIDMGDWDRLHWGLPGLTEHRRLWTAAEAWLPRVPVFDQRKESLTQMFTGTPYGPVDVVTPGSELTNYKVVAFLGWNTMTAEIYKNLLNFVKAGGVLFICGCHFDERIDLSKPPAMINDGRVSDLVGLDILGPGENIADKVRRCRLLHSTAKRIDEHFWRNEVEAGQVYFGDFFDYPSDFGLIAKIKDLLHRLGVDQKKMDPLQIETSLPYVNYSLWEHQGKIKVYATNSDWRISSRGSATTISLQDGDFTKTFFLSWDSLTVVEPR